MISKAENARRLAAMIQGNPWRVYAVAFTNQNLIGYYLSPRITYIQSLNFLCQRPYNPDSSYANIMQQAVDLAREQTAQPHNLMLVSKSKTKPRNVEETQDINPRWETETHKNAHTP